MADQFVDAPLLAAQATPATPTASTAAPGAGPPGDFQDAPLAVQATGVPRGTSPTGVARGSTRTWPTPPGSFGPSEETKRLIAGGAGALAVGAATEGLGLIPEAAAGAGALARAGLGIARSLPSVAGAYGGGGAEALREGASPGEAHEAGLSQAKIEAGGQVLGWPIKKLGQRLLASRVGRFATEHLANARQGLENEFGKLLDSADTAMRGEKLDVATATHALQGGARAEDVKALGYKQAAAQAGSRADLERTMTQEAQARHATAFQGAVPPPGPGEAAQTGQRTAAVIQGPAKQHLSNLGAAVGDAAKTGPPVDVTALKEEAQRILDTEVRPPLQSFPTGTKAPPSFRTAGGGEFNLDLANISPAARASLEEAMHSGPPAPIPSSASPAVAHLQRIASGADVVPFEDAHLLKGDLWQAQKNRWDPLLANGRAAGALKHMYGQLSDTLSTHAPYAAATQAYREATPFYTKGYAPKIMKLAVDNPEAVSGALKMTEPTKVDMLRTLLTEHTQAAGPKGVAQGQQAWNGIRSEWTSRNLIQPGIEKFGATLEKMPEDFKAAMYGDPEGKMVLDNLSQIHQAWGDAAAHGDARTLQHEANQTQQQLMAQSAVDRGGQLRRQAAEVAAKGGENVLARQQGIAQTRQTMRSTLGTPTPTEAAFKASSLASAPPPSQVAGDIIHMAVGHGGNVFRARSMGRMLLPGAGPAQHDLVQWAAYSPQGTQMLVKALTGPAPGMAVADLIRYAGINNAQGQPPPMAVSHASPPPR